MLFLDCWCQQYVLSRPASQYLWHIPSQSLYINRFWDPPKEYLYGPNPTYHDCHTTSIDTGPQVSQGPPPVPSPAPRHPWCISYLHISSSVLSQPLQRVRITRNWREHARLPSNSCNAVSNTFLPASSPLPHLSLSPHQLCYPHTQCVHPNPRLAFSFGIPARRKGSGHV